MTTLEQKQQYYLYGENGFTYKQPPRLDPSLVEEMNRFGRDEHGDPLWRFMWAGVAVVRTHPEDDRPTVRGDRAGTKIQGGRITPRQLHVRAKAPVALCFFGHKGKLRRVKREEDVPQGVSTFMRTWLH